jgi:hypothetical protein
LKGIDVKCVGLGGGEEGKEEGEEEEEGVMDVLNASGLKVGEEV